MLTILVLFLLLVHVALVVAFVDTSVVAHKLIFVLLLLLLLVLLLLLLLLQCKLLLVLLLLNL